jgi:hypothetical protein
MLSSFITGNIALNNTNNDLFNGIMGITSVSSLCLASLCITIPSVHLIYYLYDYIINNPGKYINSYYFKIRNALIITLCGNSLLWNTSSIMTFIFIFNYSNNFGNQNFNHVMASNFGYITIYTIINSILLSAAIIMKHCLYKAYYRGQLKKTSISMMPYFDADISKKIDLGLIFKI